MKKRYILLLLVLVAFVALWLVFNSITGKSTYNSLYLLPDNATVFIESDNIFNAWNTIAHSSAWADLQNIPALAKLNKEIQSIDSTINNNKLLFKILGNRQLLISYHEAHPGKYNFLAIADIGKAARIKNLAGILKNVLGENISVSERNYQSNKIIEIHNKQLSEIYFVSFVHDKLLFSPSFRLIEKAIDEQDKMTIARNIQFLDVYKKISGKGLFNVYIQHKYFNNMLTNGAGMSPNNFLNQLNNLFYSGILFNITNNGLISVEGYASTNNEQHHFFNLMHQGSSEIISANAIPRQVASVAKISINNPVDYFHQSLKQQGGEAYKEKMENLHKIEKHLEIDIEENLFGWIDKEIVLIQTKPSNLGKSNEFAVLLRAKNQNEPAKNLEQVFYNIKENTPVRVKQAAYKGCEISYISVPAMLKVIFSGLLSKIEKPYFTQIDNCVFISNHPQTLKNIIDNVVGQQTLDKNTEYQKFMKTLSPNAGLAAYIDFPVLFDNLREYFSYQTWAKIQANKPYLTSFSNAGLVLEADNDLFHLQFNAQHTTVVEQYHKQSYTYTDIFSAAETKNVTGNLVEIEEVKNPIVAGNIVIADLDVSTHEQFYADTALQLTVDLKNGLKHGTFKEFYPNGGLKIKGRYKNDKKHGNWKYFYTDGNLAYQKKFDNGEEITE